jgi:DNA-binding PadR family transcriptional regulator
MNSRPNKSAAEGDGPSQEPMDSPAPQAELPRLTPLQFLVIWLLLDGRKTGRELRRELGAWGAGMSKPAFSQMMRRLQVASLVRSDSVSEDSAGPPQRYCVYQARVNGLKRWRAASDFYARLQEPPGAEQHLFDETIQRREDQEFEAEIVRLGMAIARGEQILAERERDQSP